MKKTAYIIYIIIAVVCLSCDIYVNYDMYIDNQTSDTIQIVFLDKSPYATIDPDSLFFPPLHKKLLYCGAGAPVKNGCNYTGIREEEIKVYSSSGKRLRKDIWNVNNWDCNGSYKQGWEMIFVIREDDLE